MLGSPQTESLMRTLRVKTASLFDFEGEVVNDDETKIIALAAKQFAFLPQPVAIRVQGDEVEITYPEEKTAAQTEAARLAERAGKRAAEGNYEKAIGIWKRVLELQPSLHSARRDLAMAYVETGDVDNATNHLIEVLRLDPGDAWSWVVLANLYIREKSDKTTGEKFLRRALEIKPDDAWALNSLAAVTQEKGKPEEAIQLFERAIAANPEFANAYCGEAIVFHSLKQPDKALEALNRMFDSAKMQDARSKPIFDQGRQMFAAIQVELAERNQSNVFKLIQDYKAQVVKASGYPVRIEEEDFDSKIGATIQMAWKHKRDYHLLKTRKNFPAPLVSHLEAHELTHLRLETKARAAGTNKFFATTARTREIAIRSIGSDVERLKRLGYPENAITNVILTMVNGLCQFLMNCPLDMLIETELYNRFEIMRPAQFRSLRTMALEAAETVTKTEIRKLTPRKIHLASTTLNGAFALFLDELFHSATDYAAIYRQEDTFAASQKVFAHWKKRSERLAPGEEYKIVDEFADMVGLREWYEWLPDPGKHEISSDEPKSGTTNPSLLKAKHPAAVFYMLDALKRYSEMNPEQVRQIAFEVAMVGRNGLDYASPDEKYALSTIPGKKFSGLHMMCLMYTGFKQVAPEHDLGMDLNDPFLTALELFQKGESAHGAE
jgi:tetratricopeptide (TPR) repeat protein